MSISDLLPYIQIALSALLAGTILLQNSGALNGGALGGGDLSSVFHTRRGPEKFFFISTIVLGILFAVSSVLSLLLK